MSDSPAYKYIKSVLKYSASKTYVGSISGDKINLLRRQFNENEFSGQSYVLHTGNISFRTIEDAFLREISYNPLRFDSLIVGNYQPKTPQAFIARCMHDILARFKKIWPNGIQGYITLIDLTDVQYGFLRDLRNCFKAIAQQNMADLGHAEYRDEIVAYFAMSPRLSPSDDIRRELIALSNASAARRKYRAQTSELKARITALENEIKLNVRHDAGYTREMREELNGLKSELDKLAAEFSRSKSVKRVNPQKTKSRRIAVQQTSQQIVFDSDEFYENEAYDREQELLGTITREHDMGSTPDIFLDYMSEHNVKLR